MNGFVNRFLSAWKNPRWRWAVLIAVISDVLGIGLVLLPPVQWMLDAVTIILLLWFLGFRWPVLSALVVEAIPGLQVFPAWTLVVLAMAASQTQKSATVKKTEQQN